LLTTVVRKQVAASVEGLIISSQPIFTDWQITNYNEPIQNVARRSMQVAIGTYSSSYGFQVMDCATRRDCQSASAHQRSSIATG
jgi:hypothetical protein